MEKEVVLIVIEIGDSDEEKSLFLIDDNSNNIILKIEVFKFVISNTSSIRNNVFTMSEGNMELIKCKFIREEDKSVIMNNSEDTSLTSSVIGINGGNGVIDRCSFEGIAVDNDIDIKKGSDEAIQAIYTGSGHLNIFNYTFSSYSSIRDNGRVIYIIRNKSIVNIIGSDKSYYLFSDCHDDSSSTGFGKGGGLFLDDSGD